MTPANGTREQGSRLPAAHGMRGAGTPPLGVGAAGAASAHLEALSLLSMGVFGVVGFARGARREWLPLASAAAAYAAVRWSWPSIAGLLNQAAARLPLPGPEAGPAGPHTEAALLGAPAALVPADDSAAAWQIGVFLFVVLAAYLVSQRIGQAPPGGVGTFVRLPDLVDRMMGALMGAATGYLIATFLLARLFPGMGITLTGAGAQMPDALTRIGPPGVFAIVALFVLFGVLSLGSRSRQVFGG